MKKMYAFEDSIFERLLDALKIGDRVVVTSHMFYEFKTSLERVALAHQLLDEENLLPNYQVDVVRKCHKHASDLRNEGNQAFQKNKDLCALKSYNCSLAAAPLKSKEYALAIGNRSAVNWSLGFFEACVNDIDQALQHGYPEELRCKLLERRVKCFIKLNMKISAEAAWKNFEAQCQTMPQSKRSQYEKSIETLAQDIQAIHEQMSDRSSYQKVGCSEKPLLSYGVNSEIECASSGIELAYSEEKGRHMVATRDIVPGDVLIVEQPFASVLIPGAYSTHCYNCLKRCLSPVPCLFCVEVIFCDERCRVEGWERFHSIDCSLLPVIVKKTGKLGLLALRVLVVATQKGNKLEKLFKEVEDLKPPKDQRTLGFNEEGHYVSTDYLPIHFLIGHSDRRANADLFRRSVTAACLLNSLENLTHFFKEDADDELFYFCGGLLLQYLQSLPCNAHEVSEMILTGCSFENQEIGAAGYATLSMLNHSCDPNVVRHSYGDWAVLRAIRPIKQGEEILDNYGYHHALHSVDERQSQLSQQYFFHCSCHACQGSWPLYTDQPVLNPTYQCCQCGKELMSHKDAACLAPCSCGAEVDIVRIESDLNKSSKVFRETLSGVLEGRYQGTVPQSLIQHLILMASNVKRPWQEFSECQETIKQCLSLHANHIIFHR